MSPAVGWPVLLAGSAVAGGTLEIAGLPAGLLIGPMLVAIALAATGTTLTVPRLPFRAAQAFVGLLIANAMTAGTVRTVGDHWPLFLGVTAATLVASGVIGWLLSRFQVLPGTVAIWGSAPGAATAMVLMADAFGADSRLVAVMTYSRVVCVAAVASLLAVLMSGSLGSHGPGTAWFPPLHLLPLAETLAVALAGAAAGVLLRVPAGALVGPIVLGAALNIAGFVDFELPGWLLAISYAVVGWRIGLNFTRDIVKAAAGAMPRILASIAALIGFCFVIALVLAHVTGVDLVTAYLATSPGGMDSVAIIAASTPVNVPFVMALQALRFAAVLLFGPTLASTLARRYGRTAGADTDAAR